MQAYIEQQALRVFTADGYATARARIPRCGQMLVARYTVAHLAQRIQRMQAVEDLRSFMQTLATEKDLILIAWAFVRLGDAPERQCEVAKLLRLERLQRMSALELCRVGFWLHLIVWPDLFCLGRREEDCGDCALRPAGVEPW